MRNADTRAEQHAQPECTSEPIDAATWRSSRPLRFVPGKPFRLRLPFILPDSIGLPNTPDGPAARRAEGKKVDECQRQNCQREDLEWPPVVEPIAAGDFKGDVLKGSLDIAFECF